MSQSSLILFHWPCCNCQEASFCKLSRKFKIIANIFAFTNDKHSCQTCRSRTLVVNQTKLLSLQSLPFTELAPIKHTQIWAILKYTEHPCKLAGNTEALFSFRLHGTSCNLFPLFNLKFEYLLGLSYFPHFSV